MDELNFIFKMPDDETLAKYISIKGEKGEKGDPTKLSQLDNDTGFVTANTSDLANYYTKAQTDGAIEADVTALKTELGVPAGFFTDASETVTGEGSLITLNNTANAVFKDIKLYGDALQQGTPTPENPVDVQVVTGEQTIIISGNGQQSQSYTLMLRDLELCKLGSSQDYIYKSGGKWYKHKEVGKVVLNGSESGWSKSNATANNLYINQYIPSLAFNSVLLADKLTNRTAVQLYNNSEVGICYNTTGSGYASIRIGVSLDGAANVSDFIIWLSENPVTLYYQLAQSEEEEITDEVTIRQLEELSHYNSFEGVTTITASGNLPVLLSVEAFKNNWSGTLSGINNKLDNTYTKSETDYLLNDEVRFIFPKFWANSRSGDCNLIKYHGKNILIDSHHVDLWSNVKAMLDDNEATHIDYFILTHYHTDHQGNIKNLVNNGYIDANTVIYMSAKVSNYGSWYSGNIAEYTGFLEGKGLAYSIPQEGENLLIENKLKFTFMNCDKDILDAYANTSDGNTCSTVVLIEFGNTKALYTGDADNQVYKRLYDLGFPNCSVNLYKMTHHGINESVYVPFIMALSPSYAVQPSGIADAVKNNFGLCEDASLLKMMGAKIYSVHEQTDYIELDSDGSALNCASGRPSTFSDQAVDLTYYVDINAATNAIQDGSVNYPFSEIMQAVSAIPDKSGLRVTINVSDGHYAISHESTTTNKNRCYINTGKDIRITINGNSSDRSAVVINGVFSDYSSITLNNLTLDLDKWNGLYGRGSNIILENVLITSLTASMSERSGVVVDDNSYVVAKNLRIEYANRSIMCRGSIFVAASAVEIGSYSSMALDDSNGGIIITNDNIAFDDNANKIAQTKWRKNQYSPAQIMLAHDANATTVNLAKTLSSFDWIEIFYAGLYNQHASTGRIYSPNGKVTPLLITQCGSGGDVSTLQARATLSGTKITIDRSTRIDTNGSTVTLTHPDNPFNILKVVAGYNDYVDINS